ncbi:MAG: hypothetical protein WA775_13975 [Psychroserpens sp.]|uniref:hypothetical protein n=1 Tax=Psychroserpens sp. TaxID=2020870 RepID=UPI003C78381A
MKRILSPVILALLDLASYGQQITSCFADLEKILKHFGSNFDNVVKELALSEFMIEIEMEVHKK